MSLQKQRLIVVLGMHRSGTSVVTRGLQVMGVQLGEQLLEPIPSVNAKGFWEDRDIYLLNVEMLAQFNQEWFHLAVLTPTDVQALHQAGYFLRAVEILQQKTRDIPVFGFKDPRMAKLLPFWKAVFDHLHFDVSYILVIRHPLSVAKSLAKRDHFPQQQSHLIWLTYVFSSLKDSQNTQRVIINFDALMLSPEQQLSRLAKFLRLEIDARELQHYTSEFVEPGLRHTIYEECDLQSDPTCPPIVSELYSQLSEVAQDNISLEDTRLQNKIALWADEFERLSPTIALLDSLVSDNKTTHKTLAEKNEQLTTLTQDKLGHERQIASLKQDLSKLDNAMAEYQQQSQHDGQSITHYQGELAALTQKLFNIIDDLGLNADHQQWVVIKPFKFYQQCLWIRPSIFMKRKFPWLQRSLYSYLPISLQSIQNFKAVLSCYYPSLSANKQKPAKHSREYVDITTDKPLSTKVAKVICFYLPQLHTIPENDQWWGKGFTEWSSVRTAEPQFVNHYQPHIPDELGYYNLLNSNIQARQVELAKLYGIEGFCFYFYWFAGKRLLETPVKNYLANASLDLPFCLCWANESWNRGWDGYANDILIEQQHSAEDDIAFIQHISTYMRDDRYIRISGKPLLLVYRPGVLPTVKETTERWREWCRNNGLGEIYLAYVQSFESMAPEQMGFDATIEFPPNITTPTDITDSVTPLREDFACTIYDWQRLAERSKHYTLPDYPLFRGVCPSWDNTARRKNSSTVFLNSKPSLFQRWLKNALTDTVHRFENPDERLVFVNAWNEWAEGAHLEPDRQYGYAWLQATRDALLQAEAEIPRRKIILVVHDAHPHGAQYLSLYIAKTLASELGFKVDLILLGDGELSGQFSRWAKVHSLSGCDAHGTEAQNLALKLANSGHSAAIVNTTVSGLFLKTLHQAGLRCVALIHELNGIIKDNKLENHALAITEYADTIVFPNNQVGHSFGSIASVPDKKRAIRAQGLYKKNIFIGQNTTARRELRQRLGLADNARIILGVGYMDLRKGIDRFVEAGILLTKSQDNLFFVWVGHWDMQLQPAIEQRIAAAKLQNQFIFTGRKDDTDMYYAGADVYALSSREDPFPSVVLESLEVSVPVVGFHNSGGFDTLLLRNCGLLVEKDNTAAFANAIQALLDNPDRAHRLGQTGAAIIRQDFSFRHYLFDLLDFARLAIKRVSVIVPNYNYAHYLKQRLQSIIKQSYPVFELIILDDASTDNSIEVIEQALAETTIDYQLVENQQNSGSVFKQWQRGIQLARGDYIWICEADDIAEHEFIERSMKLFDDPQVVISYSQSSQIDHRGHKIASNYLDYTNDICPQKWLKDYICNGSEELAKAQAIKNTIPNVSAVIFCKSTLASVMCECADTLFKLRIAGDWLIYAHMLQQGKVGFIADALNAHRRHQSSVTASSSSNARHLAEIIFMQDYVARASQLDSHVLQQAEDYAKKIYQQFELDSRYLDMPRQNKAIKQALDALSV